MRVFVRGGFAGLQFVCAGQGRRAGWLERVCRLDGKADAAMRAALHQQVNRSHLHPRAPATTRIASENSTFVDNTAFPHHLPPRALPCIAAENSTFVDNNAFVFGDDVYVSDPSELFNRAQVVFFIVVDVDAAVGFCCLGGSRAASL